MMPDNLQQQMTIDEIRQIYGLDSEDTNQPAWVQSLLMEAASTGASNLANEQLKSFVLEFIPSVIINVTNLYGPEVGGALISKLQMAILKGMTNSLEFNAVFDSVTDIIATGTLGLLGVEHYTPENIERIRKVLEKPLQSYARQLGIQSGIGQFAMGQAGIISQAVSWIPGMQHAGAVGRQATQVLNMPKQAIEKANEIYLRPFAELSIWMSKNYSQLMIASYRDPYLNKTLKPTLAAIIDEAFPARDLNSNYDPLNTSQEHALDMAKQKIGQFKEKIEAFKNNHSIIAFGMDILENVLQDEGVQQKLATKVAGNTGASALAASKQLQASIADPNSFSAHFAFWMEEHFDAIVRLAPRDKQAQVQNHAILFKAAFSGRILTKEDIDTIKGKWQLTRLIESGLQSAFHTFKNLTVDDSLKDESQRKLIDVLKSNNHQKLQELLLSLIHI